MVEPEPEQTVYSDDEESAKKQQEPSNFLNHLATARAGEAYQSLDEVNYFQDELD